MHVAREEIMKYLELFAQGYSKDRVAKEVGLSPPKLNQRLNYYRFHLRHIYDMVRQGKDAVEIYSTVWPDQLEKEEPAVAEVPETSLPLLLNGINSKLSIIIDQNTSHNNMLAELLEMKRGAQGEQKPKKEKDPSHVERYKNMAGKVWTTEEDDLIIEEYNRNPRKYANNLVNILEGRTRQAISSRKWVLVNEGKIINSMPPQ